jgi:hypothetical protein
LSSWVVGHLGRPISGGEVVERRGVRVVVRKVRRKQVLEAQVSANSAGQGGSEPAATSTT